MNSKSKLNSDPNIKSTKNNELQKGSPIRKAQNDHRENNFK